MALPTISKPLHHESMVSVWQAGTWSEEMLSISAMDRGLCHGLGVFETLLIRNGQVVDFPEHWHRLEKSCAGLGIALPERVQISQAITELSKCPELPERVRLRIAATAGSGPLHELAPGKDAVFWMTAAPAAPVKEEVTLTTASFPMNERSPLAGIKSACYAEHLIALDEARRHGADDALLLNTQGHVVETATSNIFLIEQGVVLTPPLESGCLPGIMRQRVINHIQSKGWKLREGGVFPEQLKMAEAVWVTSSLKGAVPVVAIDGIELAGKGHVMLEEIRSALAQ